MAGIDLEKVISQLQISISGRYKNEEGKRSWTASLREDQITLITSSSS
jgi:hypothetical protein